MADSIKTLVKQKLEEVLKEIPLLGSVTAHHPENADLSMIPLPALYFWEEKETRDKRNRLALGTLYMRLAVFFALTPHGLGAADREMDTVQAAIHGALIKTCAFKGKVIELNEGDVLKECPNDEHGYLIQNFTLTYCHAWGDGFTSEY